MLNKFKFFKETSDKEKIEQIVKDAHEMCRRLLDSKLSHLELSEYFYTTQEAVEELGLDDELVHELVEDYVVQIIKASMQLQKHIGELRLLKEKNQELDYIPIKELVHKNLGVARNLRIQDARAILLEMMSNEDLEHLELCNEALRACSIKLKPECAYKALKLIEVKSSLES